MFECDERGVLATAGQAWSDEEVARAVGGDQAAALSGIQELIAKGVWSRNAAGAIYSRQLVLEEQKRQKCSEAGEKGGGNPTFIGHRKGKPKGSSKRISDTDTDSDSDSDISSSSGKSVREPKPQSREAALEYAAAIGLPAGEAEKWWDYYASNGWKVGRNPMRDWRAAVRNWKRNHDNGTYTGGGNSGGRQAPRGRSAEAGDAGDQGGAAGHHSGRRENLTL